MTVFDDGYDDIACQVIVVAHEQRKAKKSHSCDLCGCGIENNEHYWCKVAVYIYTKSNREVLVQRQCCKEIR